MRAVLGPRVAPNQNPAGSFIPRLRTLRDLFSRRLDRVTSRHVTRRLTPTRGSPLRFEHFEGRAMLAGDTITQWTFEGDITTPATGVGTAALISGTTSTFAAGNGGGRGWNTSAYASQSTASGVRGAEFLFSTEGYENLEFSFDHRSSATGSRWAQVDYTVDGTDWVTGFWNNAGGLSPQDAFSTAKVDFSSVTAANNNPDFGVRIMSIFSPVAFDQNAALGEQTMVRVTSLL